MVRAATLGTLVYLADPANIKTVFAGSPTVYHAGEANSMLSGLLGDSSMLVIDEEKLRQTNERLARLRAKFCGGAEAT